jgi:hypothetical protein
MTSQNTTTTPAIRLELVGWHFGRKKSFRKLKTYFHAATGVNVTVYVRNLPLQHLNLLLDTEHSQDFIMVGLLNTSKY